MKEPECDQSLTFACGYSTQALFLLMYTMFSSYGIGYTGYPCSTHLRESVLSWWQCTSLFVGQPQPATYLENFLPYKRLWSLLLLLSSSPGTRRSVSMASQWVLSIMHTAASLHAGTLQVCSRKHETTDPCSIAAANRGDVGGVAAAAGRQRSARSQFDAVVSAGS